MAVRSPYDGRACEPIAEGGLEGEPFNPYSNLQALIDQIIQDLITNQTFIDWLTDFITNLNPGGNLYTALYDALYDALYSQLQIDLGSGGTLYTDLYNLLYTDLLAALGGGGGGGGSGGPYSYAFDWGEGVIYSGDRKKIAIVDATDFPANFAGSKCIFTANPAATAVFTIKKGIPGSGTTIGQCSISTGGVVTFTSTGGLAQSVTASDGTLYTDPPADSALSTVAITLKGTVP